MAGADDPKAHSGNGVKNSDSLLLGGTNPKKAKEFFGNLIDGCERELPLQGEMPKRAVAAILLLW